MNSQIFFRLPERAAYEQFLKSLIGHQIVSVRYFEICYFDPEDDYDVPPVALWDEVSPDFHSLDYGLEIDLETGKLFSFEWDYSGPYGVGVSHQPIELRYGVMWDVTYHEQWRPLINKPIRDTKVYWTWWSSYPPPEPPESRRYRPLVVELDFDEGSRVFIGTYSILREGELSPSADEIIVIFDDKVARRYHVGPYEEDVIVSPNLSNTIDERDN